VGSHSVHEDRKKEGLLVKRWVPFRIDAFQGVKEGIGVMFMIPTMLMRCDLTVLSSFEDICGFTFQQIRPPFDFTLCPSSVLLIPRTDLPTIP